MNTGVGELLDNFFTSSYHRYTFSNDPWLSLIPRVPIQEGRIPVEAEIPQQGDVSGIITGAGLTGAGTPGGNDVHFRDVGTDYSVVDRQIATPDKFADSSISFPIREYTTGRYLAPDEDPREASSIYPKIPLQLSNIASWLSYNINSTILWEIADELETNDIIQSASAEAIYRPGFINTVTPFIPGNTIIRPDVDYSTTGLRPPTLDEFERAIRKCRTGILGNIRPDIDDVYCVMSEDMFRAIVNNNQTAFRNASFTGRESTLWTVNQVAQVFGIGLILRNGVLRYDTTGTPGFVHPMSDDGGGKPALNTDRDCALFFRRGSLLQYTSRPVSFRDVNTPEFLGSTYRWKLNYGGGVTTKYPFPTTANTRGVVALYAASGA